MNISIIIPTLNEEGYIEGLLNDLERQTAIPYEIIVVDGRSSDKTQDLVRKHSNVKLSSISPHVATQRNYGARSAQGEVLIFIDADVRLETDFLQKVNEQVFKKNLDIACPYYLPHNSSFLLKCMYYFFDTLFFLFQKIAPSGAGSCIICRREIFFRDKGFRSEFKFDDIEMIRRYGHKFRFAMLKNKVYVSDRRFVQEGTLRLFLKYIILSVLFITNQFKLANAIDYQFGQYRN